ncbi:MAG: tetratricopeptide repeat protein [Candidatus Omnitrophota bacterium]
MRKVIDLLILFASIAVLIYFGRPKLSAFYNNKGFDYFNRDQYKEAIAYFEKSLKIKPSSITYYNLANTYTKLKKEDIAVKEHKNSIQAGPENAGPYLALSQIYLDRQMYDEALNLLKRAEIKFPADLTISKIHKEVSLGYMLESINKGTDAYLAGDTAEAYALLNKALEIDPNNAYPYYILGYFYIADENYSQAETSLKEALRLKPDFLPAQILLGNLHYEKGDYQKAITQYKAGLLIDFDNSYLHNSVGLSFMNMESYDEAIAHLKIALKISPDNLNIHYSLASLYRDNGLLDQAVLEYKKILERLPGYPHIHNDLGDIYAQQGKTEAAAEEYYREIENCRRKLTVNPDDVNILDDMAYAYNKVGNHNKAKEIIGEVIKRYPRFRQAYLTLAKIEQEIGDNSKALAALTKAKSLSTQSGFIDKDIIRLKEMAVVVTGRTAFFDKIYLNNGRMIEGIILKETNEKVVLEVQAGKSWGTIALSRNEIKNIIRAQDAGQ